MEVNNFKKNGGGSPHMDLRILSSSAEREFNSRIESGRKSASKGWNNVDISSKAPEAVTRFKSGFGNHVQRDEESISLKIPNWNSSGKLYGLPKGSTLRDVSTKVKKSFNVDVQISADITNHNLSILISGIKENVYRAKAQVLRFLTPPVVKYLFVVNKLLPFILKRGSLNQKYVDITLVKSSNLSIENLNLLYSGDDPTFSTPKNALEQKSLIVLKGNEDDFDEIWEQIKILAMEVLPETYMHIDVDYSVFPFLTFSGSEGFEISIMDLKSKEMKLESNNVKLGFPSLFRSQAAENARISFYGPNAEVKFLVKRALDSKEKILKNTETITLKIPRYFHPLIAGHNEINIVSIFYSTSCFVCLPPYDSLSEEITIRGSKNKENLELAKSIVLKTTETSNLSVNELDLKELIGESNSYFNFCSYLFNCKNKEINEVQSKWNVVVTQYSLDDDSDIWYRFIQLKSHTGQNPSEAISKLSKLIKKVHSSVDIIGLKVPSIMVFRLRKDKNLILDIQPPFVDPGRLFVCALVPRSDPRSEEFGTDILVVINKKRPGDQCNTTDNNGIEDLMVGFVGHLKSILNLETFICVVPPQINPENYQSVVDFTLRPLFSNTCSEIHIVAPGITALEEFIAYSNPSYSQLNRVNICICAPADQIETEVKPTTEKIIAGWIKILGQKLHTKTLPIRKDCIYSSKFLTRKGREAKVKDLIDRITSKILEERGEGNSELSTMESFEYFNKFSIKLVNDNGTQNNSQANDSHISITGPKETVNLATKMIQEEMDVYIGFRKEKVDLFAKMSPRSMKIISAYNVNQKLLAATLSSHHGIVKSLVDKFKKTPGVNLIVYYKSNLNRELDESQSETNRNLKILQKASIKPVILEISGKTKDLEVTKKQMIEFFDQAIQKIYIESFEVLSSSLSYMFNLCNKTIRNIRSENNVELIFERKGRTEFDTIIIRGLKENVEKASARIKQLYAVYESFGQREVYLPYYMHHIMIGRSKWYSLTSEIQDPEKVSIFNIERDFTNTIKSKKTDDIICINSSIGTYDILQKRIMNCVTKRARKLGDLLKYNPFTFKEIPSNLVVDEAIFAMDDTGRNEFGLLGMRRYAETLTDVVVWTVVTDQEKCDELKNYKSHGALPESISSLLAHSLKVFVVGYNHNQTTRVLDEIRGFFFTLLDIRVPEYLNDKLITHHECYVYQDILKAIILAETRDIFCKFKLQISEESGKIIFCVIKKNENILNDILTSLFEKLANISEYIITALPKNITSDEFSNLQDVLIRLNRENDFVLGLPENYSIYGKMVLIVARKQEQNQEPLENLYKSLLDSAIKQAREMENLKPQTPEKFVSTLPISASVGGSRKKEQELEPKKVSASNVKPQTTKEAPPATHNVPPSVAKSPKTQNHMNNVEEKKTASIAVNNFKQSSQTREKWETVTSKKKANHPTRVGDEHEKRSPNPPGETPPKSHLENPQEFDSSKRSEFENRGWKMSILSPQVRKADDGTLNTYDATSLEDCSSVVPEGEETPGSDDGSESGTVSSHSTMGNNAPKREDKFQGLNHEINSLDDTNEVLPEKEEWKFVSNNKPLRFVNISDTEQEDRNELADNKGLKNITETPVPENKDQWKSPSGNKLHSATNKPVSGQENQRTPSESIKSSVTGNTAPKEGDRSKFSASTNSHDTAKNAVPQQEDNWKSVGSNKHLGAIKKKPVTRELNQNHKGKNGKIGNNVFFIDDDMNSRINNGDFQANPKKKTKKSSNKNPKSSQN